MFWSVTDFDSGFLSKKESGTELWLQSFPFEQYPSAASGAAAKAITTSRALNNQIIRREMLLAVTD